MNGLRKAVIAYNRAAGELDIARRLLHQEMDADQAARTGRRQRAVCGTPSGYMAHHRDGEQPDPACLEAHRRATAHRPPRRRTA